MSQDSGPKRVNDPARGQDKSAEIQMDREHNRHSSSVVSMSWVDTNHPFARIEQVARMDS